MSNIVILQLPVHSRAPRELSDNERNALVRSLQNIASDQYYPLSRLLKRFATMVRDYPLEEVTLKDLSPKGFMMSVDYPTYGLHWVFRLEGHSGPPVGQPVTQVDLLTRLQDAVKGLGVSMYAARFSSRFLNDLGETVLLETIDQDVQGVVVSGCIQSTPFAPSGKHQFTPYLMTLTRL
jgi:hypothetical protein